MPRSSDSNFDQPEQPDAFGWSGRAVHRPVEEPGCAEWERTYSLFTHLGLLAAHFGLPVVVSLVLWLIKRDQSRFVDDHGKEAINFQLSLVVYALLNIPLGLVTCSLSWWVIWPAVYMLGIVGMVLAAVASSKGRYFRYPMTIRFF